MFAELCQGNWEKNKKIIENNKRDKNCYILKSSHKKDKDYGAKILEYWAKAVVQLHKTVIPFAHYNSKLI